MIFVSVILSLLKTCDKSVVVSYHILHFIGIDARYSVF